MKKNKLSLLLAVIMLLSFSLTACGAEKSDIITGEDNPPAPSEEPGTDFSKYAGRKIGVTTGSVQERYVNEKVPGGICEYYDDEPAMAVALTQGKIDTFIMPYKSATELLANYPSLTYDPVPIGVDWVAHCFSKTDKGRTVLEKYNEFMAEIKASGELQRLSDKWNGDPSGWTAPDYSRIENNTEIINYASVGRLMPFCFMGDGEYQGMDLDMMVEFCEKYGYNFKMDIVPVTSLLLGLSTGVYDMGGGGIAYNEERAQSMLFGTGQSFSPQVFVVRKASSVEEPGVMDSIKEEFEKTFVTQSRWKLFASGIGTTFLITICAFVLGAIIGVGICAMMASKSKFLKGVSDWYIKILQGIPTVVTLMVLCYVVFAKASIDGVPVAIIGFALVVGSETGDLYYRAIKSVGRGQREAGLSIGLSPYQTFRGIVLPQAMKVILPGYKNCFIALLKATAVAGYIAVQDLTKMSDIIRSRTYSAFFPLISTAVIYFIASYVIARILEKLIESSEPKRENRTIKGVKIHD